MTVAAPVHTTGTQLPNYTTIQTKNGVQTVPDTAGGPITPTPAQIPIPASVLPSTSPTSGTVLSNANVIENTIPKLNNAAAGLTTSAPTALALPETDYNTLYGQAYDGLPDETQDPVYKQEMDLINNLQSENDSTANTSVNSIMKNYADLASQTQQRDNASSASLNNSLLLGGSSRYAPVSTAGILDAKTTSDMQDLSTLQDQESQKIAEVKQAQANQDYQLMEKKLSELDGIRSDKQTLAKSIATNMQTQNSTLRTQQVQASRDNAIAGLVEQGITDPDQILDTLNNNPNGQGDFTATEVATTLGNIQKNTGISSLEKLSGGVGDFYTLKATGNLPESIAGLPDNQQLFAYLKQVKAANTIPKTTSTKASSSAIAKPVVSGTLTYTPQDYADDSKVLEASRGTDGYVDPAVYQKLYTAWVNGGGKVADFLKTYPVKDYVNPANTTLPTYLRPTSPKKAAASSSSVTDPFG